jgi:hypothetical protein
MVKIQVPPRVLSEQSVNEAFTKTFSQTFELATLEATLIKYHLMKSPSKKILPYTEARLSIPAPESKDQRWFIRFCVWDASLNKKVKKTDYTCNSIKDLKKRLRKANEDIETINKALRQGYIIDEEKHDRTFAESNEMPTVAQAIHYTLFEKKSLKHFKDYDQKLNRFLSWCEENKLDQLPLNRLKSVYIKQFANYLATDEKLKLSVRTVNNYLNTIGNIFSTIKSINEDLEFNNPIEHIARKKNPKGKNLPFNEAQQKQLLEYASKHEPWMMLFNIFMFYTLARTSELAKLQVWMIGHLHPNQIYFPASIVKDGHNTGIDKHVVIPEQLQEYIELFKIKEFPPKYYIFSKGFAPSKDPYPSKYMGTRYRENVLNKFDGAFPIEYTLYSWKATGTSMYLLNGASTGSIMQQAGWQNLHSIQSYIKGLGMITNTEISDKASNLKIKKP